LVDPAIFVSLLSKVLPDYTPIDPTRRDKIASRPEMLTGEVPLPSRIGPGDVNRTLALDVPNHLSYGIFPKNYDQPTHMV
jgi:hypothetical protein